MKDKFYVTTTLPYVNAAPHIGFALELVQADIVARYHRAQGSEVFYNTGTDEHGLKIYRKALEEGKDPQEYADENAKKFDDLKGILNLSYNNFIRTTDDHHIKAAQEFWKRCDRNGDIEKKTYKIKYCVGCELEKTDSELVDGYCSLHSNQKLEVIEEENYFFKFSNYGDKLLALYKERPDFVVPDHRFNEIKKFVESGLRDFSISRLKERLPWGVPVPGDENHVMYVWFDALVNYISAVGWPDRMDEFEKWWPVIQFAGKDQIRQQAAMWQAMLLSAGLEPSKQIFIHGFINVGGEKISKSVGNIVDPNHYVNKYGTDAVRYYLSGHIHPFEDSDFSEESFRDVYQADLANGLGNFASRATALAEKVGGLDGFVADIDIQTRVNETITTVTQGIQGFRLHEAVAKIWNLIRFGDGYIDSHKPWETEDKQAIFNVLYLLDAIAGLAEPIMPEASAKIKTAIQNERGKLVGAGKISNLFPRLDA